MSELRLPLTLSTVNPATEVPAPVKSVAIKPDAPLTVSEPPVVPTVADRRISDIKAVTDINELKRLAAEARGKQDEEARSKTTTVKFAILEQDAHSALATVVETLKADKPLLYAALHACSIKPTDKGIKLIAANSVQQAQIEKEGETVLTLLRAALKEEIGMHVEHNASEANNNTEKIPYTATERFEYLAKINPLIRKLRDDFNFDVS